VVKKIDTQKQTDFWKGKLKSYQEKYKALVKESPERWWHDEFFDNQTKVLLGMIATAKERLEELKKKTTGKI